MWKKKKTCVLVSLSIKFEDSKHAQLSIYAVFDEECNFQVKNDEI